MKKLIVTLSLVLSCFIAKSQTDVLPGALGIPFGASEDSVKAVMKRKFNDAKFYERWANAIVYSDGYWAGHPVLLWILSISEDNHFHTAKVCIKSKDTEDIFDLYDRVCDDLKNKYGEYKRIENWKYPYTKDDKYKFGESAIKNGKATFMTYWEFPGSDPEHPETKNILLVEIGTTLTVTVCYQGGIEVQKSNEIKKKKNVNDL